MIQMSMNKVIHGAFRRDLDRFVAALGSFPVGDQGAAEGLAAAWTNFEDQLTHHHDGEHTTAWPALREVGVSSALLATMDAEHSTMTEALGTARSALAELVRTPGQEQAAAALAGFEQLRAVTVAHLDHEEAEIEQVYLDNVDHPAIVAMGKQFAKVGPARGGRFLAWLQDGATADQRAAIAHTIPGPVRTVLTTVFGRGYTKNVATVWSR